MRGPVTVLLLCLAVGSAGPQEPARLKALIVDGQSNHADWPLQTRMIRRYLEETDLFTVDVATSPPRKTDLSGFRPKFADYDVVVSVYNGDLWPEKTRNDFVAYMKGGGGFVSVHAADNPFPEWKEYNRMIGLGGWYRRDARSGPYVYFDGKSIVRDDGPGRGGSHGVEHAFPIVAREPDHPILKGLPPVWMHERDELYDRLRGPAENLTVLATAFSDTATGGSGRHEPMLMTIEYGKGRVFHTTLGHGAYSRECVGFLVTLQRGTEWAATGKVSQSVPDDFPTADRTRARPFAEHRGPVLSVAWSPDGKTVATGGEDGVIWLWDGRTGRQRIPLLHGHSAPVTSLDYSKDGSRLVSSGRILQVWDARKLELTKTLEYRGLKQWGESVAFSPDGRSILRGGRPARIVDLESGKGTNLRGPFVRGVAFSPDGTRIAGAGADRSVLIWTVESPADPVKLQGHTDSVDAVTFHPGGKVAASGARDGSVRLWDLTSKASMGTIQPKAGWINDVAFSPDGKLLAVAHSGLTLWDVESGRRLAILTRDKGRVFAAAFSPDGSRLAAAGDDPTVRIWNVRDVLK